LVVLGSLIALGSNTNYGVGIGLGIAGAGAVSVLGDWLGGVAGKLLPSPSPQPGARLVQPGEFPHLDPARSSP
jgi:hypothetical protein